MNAIQSHLFNDKIAVRYQLYNSLFNTLPYGKIDEVAGLLSLFGSDAKKQLFAGKAPWEIVESFLSKWGKENRADILFRILQTIEREVVLFDAIEDAAFSSFHQPGDPGTVTALMNRVIEEHRQNTLASHLNNYRVRVVLTAHPTQFYPDPVLSIIRELTEAIIDDNLEQIRLLLLQLGRTRFRNREKPTPIMEANSVLWYIENNFYEAIPEIREQIMRESGYCVASNDLRNMLEIGFWPGGDRDGNPFVTAETTIKVAQELKESILRKYRSDLKQLMKRLTFDGIFEQLLSIVARIEATLSECRCNEVQGCYYRSPEELEEDLRQLLNDLHNNHQGLFAELVEKLLSRVQIFGFHFAIMDIRQDSSVYKDVTEQLICALAETGIIPHAISEQWNSSESNISLMKEVLSISIPEDLSAVFDRVDSISRETINTYRAVKVIRQSNGKRAIHRSIISNTQSVDHLFQVLTLNHIAVGTSSETALDVVPLFETISDLKRASEIMKRLYCDEVYRPYLDRLKSEQHIMVGFSDGTKDGGYLGANLGIYRAKQALTRLSRDENVHVLFFDGRGGPPARGGGNTHRFYRSLGNDISHDQIQLTIQGQTISSNFGTVESARYNIEQIFTAGLESYLFHDRESILSEREMALLEEISAEAYLKYQALKEDELFVPYLDEMTPLRYYDRLNVGSRPVKRKKSILSFSDLRAIPFVGSWSQIKQNVPGFYGLGTALQSIRDDEEKWAMAKELYQENLFFQTLMDNAMQSLAKTFFPLTQYLKEHHRFGTFWQTLSDEAQLSTKLLCELADIKELLQREEVIRSSIALREKIILPLLVVQQYALEQIQREESGELMLAEEEREVLVKLVVKSLAANINASRNSA
jgi:phosphoenolpyruvate carboxylase